MRVSVFIIIIITSKVILAFLYSNYFLFTNLRWSRDRKEPFISLSHAATCHLHKVEASRCHLYS